MDRAFKEIIDQIEAPRYLHRLIVDVRQGPARNDPAYEASLERHRLQLFNGFAAIATVVKTRVGLLQVQRLSKGEHPPLLVTESLEAALAHCNVGPHTWPLPVPG
jgi:hypothetical protein